MNPKFPAQLAEKVAANPALFEEMEASLLGDLVFDYHHGELDEESAAEVAALIQTNSTVRAVHQRILDAEKYASSENGRAWLEGMFDRALAAASASADVRPAESYFAGLARTISALFTSRLATASGEEGLEKLLDEKTLVEVKPDSAGRLWLQVTSKDERFRNGIFKFEVEDGPSLLRFAEVRPGVYSAQVCVEPDVAEKLAQGAKPNFIPAESTE